MTLRSKTNSNLRNAHPFFRFCLVGSLGFVTDAAVFFYVVHLFNDHWLLARVSAFITAVGVTWAGNRYFTFRSESPPQREGLLYFSVQSAGCLVNYLFFLTGIALWGTHYSLVAPYLLGTSAGMVFNYALSRHLVFRKP